jgi:hypothetical protein
MSLSGFNLCQCLLIPFREVFHQHTVTEDVAAADLAQQTYVDSVVKQAVIAACDAEMMDRWELYQPGSRPSRVAKRTAAFA